MAATVHSTALRTTCSRLSGMADVPKHWHEARAPAGTPARASARTVRKTPTVSTARVTAASSSPADQVHGNATSMVMATSVAAITAARWPRGGSPGSVANQAAKDRKAGLLRSLVNAETANTRPITARHASAT
jgi:hypothetical protein